MVEEWIGESHMERENQNPLEKECGVEQAGKGDLEDGALFLLLCGLCWWP